MLQHVESRVAAPCLARKALVLLEDVIGGLIARAERRGPQLGHLLNIALVQLGEALRHRNDLVRSVEL